MPINHAAAPPRILWSEGAQPGELVVQIRSTDRAGLLARLTAVFERDGVDIAWAKVTTLGSSVVDLFGIVVVAAVAAGDGAEVRDETRTRPVRGAAHPAAREAGVRKPARLARVFESLSDRLTGVLQGLRGKGRLTDADIDATAREIRLALLEADVSLPVVRAFVTRIKERAKGRGGIRRAEPGPAGRQDRQRGTGRHPRRRDPPAGVRQDPADGGHARGPAGFR